jgi:hypothetical protein
MTAGSISPGKAERSIAIKAISGYYSYRNTDIVLLDGWNEKMYHIELDYGKGGFACIPALKGEVFPLCPRKINNPQVNR